MNYQHSGSLGDILYSLWCIQDMQRRYDGGKPANLYLQCGVRADYAPGIVHPCGNARMTKEMAEALIPLLKSQPYFREVALYTDQRIEVNLDLFRCLGINYACGHIPRYYSFTFACSFDLSQPCLFGIEPDARYAHQGRLVVNRTSRYQNPRISYASLSPYRPLFLGLPQEYQEFVKTCPGAEYQPTKDYLEVARIIAASKVFVGNQSSCFAVAECLKTPRVLEVSLQAPNVVPHGPGARDAVNQTGFEANVAELMS